MTVGGGGGVDAEVGLVGGDAALAGGERRVPHIKHCVAGRAEREGISQPHKHGAANDVAQGDGDQVGGDELGCKQRGGWSDASIEGQVRMRVDAGLAAPNSHAEMPLPSAMDSGTKYMFATQCSNPLHGTGGGRGALAACFPSWSPVQHHTAAATHMLTKADRGRKMPMNLPVCIAPTQK